MGGVGFLSHFIKFADDVTGMGFHVEGAAVNGGDVGLVLDGVRGEGRIVLVDLVEV